MRDVIVIGAGGGGPVVAKELAARGLDVLLLEAGPRNLRPSDEWSHLENDAHNPVSGFLRVGPADRQRPGWLRELPQEQLSLADLWGRWHDPSLSGELPEGHARGLSRLSGARSRPL